MKITIIDSMQKQISYEKTDPRAIFSKQLMNKIT